MGEWIKKIFYDKDGNPSSKRIIGGALVITAVFFTAFGLGDVELVKTMFYSGMIGIGVPSYASQTIQSSLQACFRSTGSTQT